MLSDFKTKGLFYWNFEKIYSWVKKIFTPAGYNNYNTISSGLLGSAKRRPRKTKGDALHEKMVGIGRCGGCRCIGGP